MYSEFARLRARTLVAGFAALILGGCSGDLPQLPTEEVPRALSVSFLLQRGGAAPEGDLPAGRIYGFVGRVSDPNAPYLLPVFDANATLAGRPLQVRRTEGNEFYTGQDRPLEGEYNYFTDSVEVSAATEYTLTVDQGGDRLIATTRVPGDFQLRAINGTVGGTTVPRGEPLTLTWGRSDGAALYSVNVFSRQQGLETGISTRLPFFTADTVAALPLTSSASSIPVTIEIRAMDPNLYRASAHRDVQAGIDGGYGFFGSVNVRRYNLTLTVR
ncbi:MAG TPA: hypothetical protein VLK84_17705 [Longimicrobium sp.]|nr:hypothetical protein [Longimicrobium sp.]